jgi:hypothetical protein
MSYIVTICFKKIFSQINCEKSWPFVAVLHQITIKDISYMDDQHTSYDQTSSREKDADTVFLCKLATPNSSITFLERYPKLLGLANAASLENLTLNLYNTDTCQEIHELLLFLLNTFYDNIKDMVQHSCPTGHYGPPPLEFNFVTAATVVCWVGHALVLLTMGAAL